MMITLGAAALNKLLGREVYTCNTQLGGVQIMYNNGVSHKTERNDSEGVGRMLHWLSYMPAYKGGPLPILEYKDTWDREVQFTPPQSRYREGQFTPPQSRYRGSVYSTTIQVYRGSVYSTIIQVYRGLVYSTTMPVYRVPFTLPPSRYTEFSLLYHHPGIESVSLLHHHPGIQRFSLLYHHPGIQSTVHSTKSQVYRCLVYSTTI